MKVGISNERRNIVNIQPGTKLYLLQGVPITNNYKDTLYFANPTDQWTYFYSKRVQTYSDFTYQRVESNKVRVALGAESCYTVNYMMFKNESFGTRWFYAFVTNAEYINNECTELTYEIDKIQTWWFDLTLKPCMVKRQHDVTDDVYVNCEPEEFNLTARYVNWEKGPEEGNVFVTLTTGHWNSNADKWVTASMHDVSNMPCAMEINYFEDTAAGRLALYNYLYAIISNGHEEEIVCVYCASKYIGTTPVEAVKTNDTYSVSKATLRSGAFQGYVPKNNKLYNYPFCKLVARTPTGEQEYAIEDFRSGTSSLQITDCNFRLFAISIPTPTLLLVPRDYRGESFNYESGIDIVDFPFVPFKGDTFQMWATQNTGGYAMNLLGQLGGALLGMANADVIGGAIGLRGAIESGANWAGQAMNWENKPDNIYGLQKGNIFSNMHINGFRLQSQTIDYWQARQIDSYFTMYGYAQNTVMTPNIHARSKWTYIQTADCTLVGNAPSDDISFIESCFNKGITWWVNASEVGRYDLTNAVLT